MEVETEEIPDDDWTTTTRDDVDDDADEDPATAGPPRSRGSRRTRARSRVDDPDAVRVALRIPEDPSALSFLLTGIVQVEPDRRQALLEAASADERLRDIDALLDRELMLLGARLAPFAVDRRALAGSDN